MIPTSPVAITGMGCLCAPGPTLALGLGSIFRKHRKPAPPLRFTSNHPVSYPVFEVPDDLTSLSIQGTKDISRTARLALAAALEAIDNAGLDRAMLRSKRVGVCLGTSVGNAMNSELFHRQFRKGEDPEMAPITRYLRSNPVDVLVKEFDLIGPSQTVVNACSSGTDAIGLGALWIQSGLCDMVLAGGADELCHVTYNGFISLMITDDSPCKPFDKDRKGLNLGEGAAVLVLESEKSRQARGKASRAFVRGYGASCDAYHLTAPHPQGRGLRRAIEEAMRLSGVSPEELGFINAHGTGTKDNDRVESQVFTDLLPGVPFLSTKGYTGHALGAAGAIEAALTVACLEEGRIPESAGFTTPDPELPAFPAGSEMRVGGTVALSESLAFGGHNAVLVFGLERGLP
jgi:3-oxoacyl-[acyl-carrier-protein] synthase II